MEAGDPMESEGGGGKLWDPVLIVGPTAVGKSGLALALAEQLPVEIINADALQVYRGLDLGTAKPSAEERARVRHHLIDILEPTEAFSAGDFRRRALPIIEDVRSRGRLPVVVGGSGLYLRTLVSGISPIPEIPESIRQATRELLAGEGLDAVRRRLTELDPETAARLSAGDSQRHLRALEVVIATGRGLTAWWRDAPPQPSVAVLARLGLTLPRTLLYDRITRRLQTMVAAGWVDEVRDLLAGGCLPGAPAFQAIGYRQVIRHINGEWSLERALEDTARATRRFAKRQLTWFRKEPDVEWIEAESPMRSLPQAIATIETAR